MAEKQCEECGEINQRKNLGKINGKNLCRKCRILVRKNHRKKTINDAGIKEDLIKLSKKQKEQYNKIYNDKRKKENQSEEIPTIKGSKKYNRKEKTQSYLTLQDKQALLRILMARGLNFKEARERLSEVVKEQARVRKKMKEKNKSEEDIKIKQRRILEELWNY